MIFDRNVPGMTEVLGRATVGIAGCGGLGTAVIDQLGRGQSDDLLSREGASRRDVSEGGDDRRLL